MQITPLNRCTSGDALTVAFKHPAGRPRSLAQRGLYSGRKVKFAVAIGIRAGKLKEGLGGWMQYVRL